ncbi:(2Fe-2S)-binding protein [Peribacillus sp. B-H-3]|jgi:aerobic carbon-monoxide dehydrogenase small subunit|uniref:(2Fe-2S)-binding protein n=1 Tax=Peribacillus sp. B-H-3 TaxID=3400420 RepID=UPI003B0286EC
MAHTYLASIKINEKIYETAITAFDILLDVLRRQGLTGAKPGCRNGDCGACTILMNGRPMKSCLVLAIEAEDSDITTIEGLVDSPIQKAFVDHFAFQCGYCTPGFIMNIHGLLLNHPNPDKSLITEWLSSNICRCTGYKEIEEAVLSVLKENRQLPEKNQ